MISPDVDAACLYALQRLRDKLSPDLYYPLAHTQNDVLRAAERLAVATGVRTTNSGLLRTAAWYHHLGFVERHTNHKATGAATEARRLHDLKKQKNIGLLQTLLSPTPTPPCTLAMIV